MMARVRQQQQRGSAWITQFLASCCGDRFPFYYVCEYPKSGGTWLATMLADYLNVPYAEIYTARKPVWRSSVLRTHWTRSKRLKRCVYLRRDGRDVMVSLYFHHMFVRREDPTPFGRKLLARYEQTFGRGYDPNDVREHLPRFLEHVMSGAPPRVGGLPWPAHIECWQQGEQEHIAHVSYEELLSTPKAAVTRCLEHLTRGPVDPGRLERAVETRRFARMAGRPAGEEDRGSFFRKGVAGDWKNYFGREAARVFDHYAGETLIALGYEEDHAWVQRLER